MQCPICPDTRLVMSERSGVEIDYCPQCRGVWLDRGELDKLIDRAASHEARSAPAPAPQTHPGHARRPDFVDSDYGKRGYYKRKSWLSDIFD